MNDLHHPCEPWAERISLAAAGCLSTDEERDVRRHIETCSDCRERFRQLTQVCGVLAEARLPADSAEAAIVERVMSAVTSGKSGQPIVRTRAEMIHPTLLTRSLTKWRWIMRSPVSRVAAAVIFILAITGVALLFHGFGTTYVFADFVKPILEAKTAKFKITVEMKGQPTTTGKVMVLDATRTRQEMEMTIPDMSQPGKSNKSKGITITDFCRGTNLVLDPAAKKAMVITLANLTKEQVEQQDMFAMFRSLLTDARDRPDVNREPLGEKDVDGHRVVGFRVSTKAMVTSVWGDPKTGLPVRVEMTVALYPDVKSIMSDFEFNVPMDESLFSIEPPLGYTVENQKIDVSPTEEKNLIETFRLYSELSGGAFPESLDMQQIMQKVGMMIGKKCAIQAIREKLNSGNDKLSEEQIRKNAQDAAKKNAEASMKEFIKVQIPLQRGLIFVFTLPRDADACYAGKGVSKGAADRPIFWYRPKDAKKYRVIYADLSVREADMPPSVPNAQPVPAPAGPKK
jgi:outer membrane lipoprotein-sorting protein